MNAPARFPTIDPQAGWTDAQRAYAMAVDIHCPGCTETERKIRVDLCEMRDMAVKTAPRVSETASVLLGEVARQAMIHAYAHKPESELFRAWATLDLMVETARVAHKALRGG